MRQLAPLVEQVTPAPGIAPLLSLAERSFTSSLEERQALYESDQPRTLVWSDGLVALRFRGIRSEVVAAEISYRDTSGEQETTANLLILRRCELGPVSRLLVETTEQRRAPQVSTLRDRTEEIEPYAWEWLTLAPEIRSALQEDFESFFNDREWYPEMRIPHRRGYLLHGPPGNGKTSVVKAMLTSRGLTAYQMRLFDSHSSDSDLEALFRKAAARSPSMILLEDIDRAFPKAGAAACKISLQTLLNCVDGIVTGTGIVVVATANHPSLLDPAILRRPGRFDRVVFFANPTPELRQHYWANMHQALAEADLSETVELSEGFSFAQLRESYILAAQRARRATRTIAREDLVAGVQTLRSASRYAMRKSDIAGFVNAAHEEASA